MSSLAQTRQLLQHIGEGFVFVDEDFRVRAMNAEAVRIEGRPASEILNRTLWEAWPQYGQGSALYELWVTVMRDRVPASLEQFSVRTGRDPLWLEIRAFPSGTGMAVFVRDVTERKRSQEELLRSQAELIHASRVSAMGAMASTLEHELSQPLSSVSDYVDASERIVRTLAADGAREAALALSHASSEARKASEILARLRDFVPKRLETATHDLRKVIADACMPLLPHAQRQGVEIEFALDRDAKWVRVDAVQIQQVLISLVNNAIEAMETSKEKRITIASRQRADGQIEIAVADTGPGVGADATDSLFSPFVNAESDRMGLGLSISRAIVEAHGGSIAADRPASGGAVFRFTLPRAEQAGAG
jgi:two-component system sensor kinase FixL